MPLYSVQQRLATRVPDPLKWSYVWFGLFNSPLEAALVGRDMWVNLLRTCHHVDAFCYEVYATDQVAATTSYAIVPVPEGQSRGALTGGGEPVPLWNAVRVDMFVQGSRPSRKFLRPPMKEGYITTTNGLAPTLVAAIRDVITAITGDLRWRDESGQVLEGVGPVRLTSRRLGRLAGFNVPEAPPVG